MIHVRVRNTGLPGSKKLLLQHLAVVPSIQYRIAVSYQDQIFENFIFRRHKTSEAHILQLVKYVDCSRTISVFCSVDSFLQTQFCPGKPKLLRITNGRYKCVNKMFSPYVHEIAN